MKQNISYEVSEDTSNIGGTCLQASFSEMGIKPMTFKELVGVLGAPTDIMFGDEKVNTLGRLKVKEISSTKNYNVMILKLSSSLSMIGEQVFMDNSL